MIHDGAEQGRNKSRGIGQASTLCRRRLAWLDEFMRRRSYTVSDGRMVLTLTPAKEGGYVVTSPLDPEVITEAETVPEAFQMARDAARALRAARAKLLRKLAAAS